MVDVFDDSGGTSISKTVSLIVNTIDARYSEIRKNVEDLFKKTIYIDIKPEQDSWDALQNKLDTLSGKVKLAIANESEIVGIVNEAVKTVTGVPLEVRLLPYIDTSNLTAYVDVSDESINTLVEKIKSTSEEAITINIDSKSVTKEINLSGVLKKKDVKLDGELLASPVEIPAIVKEADFWHISARETAKRMSSWLEQATRTSNGDKYYVEIPAVIKDKDNMRYLNAFISAITQVYSNVGKMNFNPTEEGISKLAQQIATLLELQKQVEGETISETFARMKESLEKSVGDKRLIDFKVGFKTSKDLIRQSIKDNIQPAINKMDKEELPTVKVLLVPDDTLTMPEKKKTTRSKGKDVNLNSIAEENTTKDVAKDSIKVKKPTVEELTLYTKVDNSLAYAGIWDFIKDIQTNKDKYSLALSTKLGDLDLSETQNKLLTGQYGIITAPVNPDIEWLINQINKFTNDVSFKRAVSEVKIPVTIDTSNVTGMDALKKLLAVDVTPLFEVFETALATYREQNPQSIPVDIIPNLSKLDKDIKGDKPRKIPVIADHTIFKNDFETLLKPSEPYTASVTLELGSAYAQWDEFKNENREVSVRLLPDIGAFMQVYERNRPVWQNDLKLHSQIEYTPKLPEGFTSLDVDGNLIFNIKKILSDWNSIYKPQLDGKLVLEPKVNPDIKAWNDAISKARKVDIKPNMTASMWEQNTNKSYEVNIKPNMTKKIWDEYINNRLWDVDVAPHMKIQDWEQSLKGKVFPINVELKPDPKSPEGVWTMVRDYFLTHEIPVKFTIEGNKVKGSAVMNKTAKDSNKYQDEVEADTVPRYSKKYEDMANKFPELQPLLDAWSNEPNLVYAKEIEKTIKSVFSKLAKGELSGITSSIGGVGVNGTIDVDAEKLTFDEWFHPFEDAFYEMSDAERDIAERFRKVIKEAYESDTDIGMYIAQDLLKTFRTRFSKDLANQTLTAGRLNEAKDLFSLLEKTSAKYEEAYRLYQQRPESLEPFFKAFLDASTNEEDARIEDMKKELHRLDMADWRDSTKQAENVKNAEYMYSKYPTELATVYNEFQKAIQSGDLFGAKKQFAYLNSAFDKLQKGNQLSNGTPQSKVDKYDARIKAVEDYLATFTDSVRKPVFESAVQDAKAAKGTLFGENRLSSVENEIKYLERQKVHVGQFEEKYNDLLSSVQFISDDKLKASLMDTLNTANILKGTDYADKLLAGVSSKISGYIGNLIKPEEVNKFELEANKVKEALENLVDGTIGKESGLRAVNAALNEQNEAAAQKHLGIAKQSLGAAIKSQYSETPAPVEGEPEERDDYGFTMKTHKMFDKEIRMLQDVEKMYGSTSEEYIHMLDLLSKIAGDQVGQLNGNKGTYQFRQFYKEYNKYTGPTEDEKIETVTKFVGDSVKKFISKAGSFITNKIVSVIEKVKGIFVNVIKKMFSYAVKPFTKSIKLFTNSIKQAANKSKTLGSISELLLTPLVIAVEYTLLPVLTKLIPHIKEVIDWVVRSKDDFTLLGKAIANVAVNIYKVVASNFITGFTKFADSLSSNKESIEKVYDNFTTFFQDLSKENITLDNLKENIKKVGDVVDNINGAFISFAKNEDGSLDFIGGFTLAISEALGKSVSTVFKAAHKYIMNDNNTAEIKAALSTLGKYFLETLSVTSDIAYKFVDTIGNTIIEVLSNSKYVNNITNNIQKIASRIIDIIGKVLDTKEVQNGIWKVIMSMAPFWSAALIASATGSVITSAIGKFGELIATKLFEKISTKVASSTVATAAKTKAKDVGTKAGNSALVGLGVGTGVLAVGEIAASNAAGFASDENNDIVHENRNLIKEVHYNEGEFLGGLKTASANTMAGWLDPLLTGITDFIIDRRNKDNDNKILLDAINKIDEISERNINGIYGAIDENNVDYNTNKYVLDKILKDTGKDYSYLETLAPDSPFVKYVNSESNTSYMGYLDIKISKTDTEDDYTVDTTYTSEGDLLMAQMRATNTGI